LLRDLYFFDQLTSNKNRNITDVLVKIYLFSTKEKVFKHIQKRYTIIFKSDNLLTNILSKESSTEIRNETATSPMQQVVDWSHEEVLLNFVLFDEVLIQIQLLMDANRKKVECYKEKKEQISSSPVFSRINRESSLLIHPLQIYSQSI